MEIRQMTAAYLFNGDRILMIKKSKSRLHNEAFWSGLGGHLEPEELNSPRTACLREIYEESGIEEAELSEVKLRYILMRMKENEIRQQFVYFGKTMRERVVASNEGELYWLELGESMTKPMSRISREMLEHYTTHSDDENVYVGVITIEDRQEPIMQWSVLRDPMIF